MVRIREQDNENSVTISVFSANSQNEVINASSNVDLLSAKLARDWAIKTDGKVEGEDYSAKYYAQQTAQSLASFEDSIDGINDSIEELGDDFEEISSDVSDINTALSGYGNIVTHNVSEFATSAQGTLASTAIQPQDNVSLLVNDAGYLTEHQDLSGYVQSSELANVATSGNYSDLNGVPVFATVATSGSYDDLSNKPTIPTVNNAKLTIQKNGTTVQTFTANASSDVTCNITVPTTATDVGALSDTIPVQTTTNLVTSVSSSSTDTEYPSAKCMYDALSGKQPSGNYLTGITGYDVTSALGYTPYNSSNPNGYTSNVGTVTKVNNASPDSNGNVTLSIPDAQVNSDWNASSGVSKILNKPSFATVATSGSYDDLNNKPSIPAATTEATVSGWGFTKNTGTVTKVNNNSPDSNGNVTISIPTVPTIATSVSSSSTNAQTVGAKLFYDTVGDIETLINAL